MSGRDRRSAVSLRMGRNSVTVGHFHVVNGEDSTGVVVVGGGACRALGFLDDCPVMAIQSMKRVEICVVAVMLLVATIRNVNC